MQILPPPPKRSRREIRDARLPPVPPPLPRHSSRLRPLPPPLPRLRVVTQEGNGHEGPSVAAREEVEDTMQRRLSSEESSGHRLDARLKTLYYSNFVLHFGMSKSMIAAMDDLLEVQGGEENSVKLGSGVRQMISDICVKYDVKKFYYCNYCDGILPSKGALCSNGGCRLQGAPYKRSRRQARTHLATVKIYPQLVEVLKSTIDTLIKVHGNVHARFPSSPTTRELSDFELYREDMESTEDFCQFRINVVLTASFDGVRLKKLKRSEAWPFYLRLEGLPFVEKHKFENVLIGALLFIRKSPTEAILREMVNFLKSELDEMKRFPIIVRDRDGRKWTCRPKLCNAVMDFAAIRALYKSPNWFSKYGCHQCTFPGEKEGRRMVWFQRFANPNDRRTRESTLADADARRNGLSGRTAMMEIIGLERCHPESLHLLDEGITTDLFKELFTTKGRAHEFRVRREDINSITCSLERQKNYSYASKMILGTENFSMITGSEKRALMGVVFPVVAAQKMCRELVACSAILIYWILMRMLDITHRCDTDLAAIRDIATNMKYLWVEVSQLLFTLKVHVLLDHAILEDLLKKGSPTHWSSAGFESLHRRLQLRVDQCTTNCGDGIIQRFLARRELVNSLKEETKTTNNPCFRRLLERMSSGAKARFPPSVLLPNGWYIPCSSEVLFTSLMAEHKSFLARYVSRYNFSSRVVHKNQVFVSKYYWRSQSLDTSASCVVLVDEEHDIVFANIVLFVHDPICDSLLVLVEEMQTSDPFYDLAQSLRSCEHPATLRALSAVHTVQRFNRFFMQVSGCELKMRNGFQIQGPSTCLTINGATYMSVL